MSIYNHTTTFLLTILLLATSCEDAFETTLDIDPPEFTPQLAVHAYGNTYDHTLTVSLTEAVSILEDSSADLYNEATVRLYKEDDLIYTLDNVEQDPSSSYYNYYNFEMPEGIHIFELGATYRIEVKSDKYPTATATTIVPSDIIPMDVSIEEDAGSDIDGNEVSAVDITFIDDASVKNFYETALLLFDGDVDPENNNFDINTESFDPVVEDGIRYDIFNDNTFDGEEKNLEITFDTYYLGELDNGRSLGLLWKVVSEDYYLFSKSADKNEETEDNPFATPVQIYSNVDNGIGIFSIANQRLIEVTQ